MSEEMKKYELELLGKTIVGEDYYIFDFSVPKGISFKEGQYGVFLHIDKDIEGRKMRAFSIASSNTEDVFKVATKIIKEPSDFKVKMRELSIGDKMSFTGPMGSFTLEKDYHSVFIAGGIGITPIRGILKQLEELKLDKDSILIYSEPREIYPFKDDFDKMDFLESRYRKTAEKTKKAIDEVSFDYQNKAFYYISGSPSFVSAITKQLLNAGVDKMLIKFDRFNGY